MPITFISYYLVPFETVVEQRHPQLQERLQEKTSVLPMKKNKGLFIQSFLTIQIHLSIIIKFTFRQTLRTGLESNTCETGFGGKIKVINGTEPAEDKQMTHLDEADQDVKVPHCQVPCQQLLTLGLKKAWICGHDDPIVH